MYVRTGTPPEPFWPYFDHALSEASVPRKTVSLEHILTILRHILSLDGSVSAGWATPRTTPISSAIRALWATLTAKAIRVSRVIPVSRTILTSRTTPTTTWQVGRRSGTASIK